MYRVAFAGAFTGIIILTAGCGSATPAPPGVPPRATAPNLDAQAAYLAQLERIDPRSGVLPVFGRSHRWVQNAGRSPRRRSGPGPTAPRCSAAPRRLSTCRTWTRSGSSARKPPLPGSRSSRCCRCVASWPTLGTRSLHLSRLQAGGMTSPRVSCPEVAAQCPGNPDQCRRVCGQGLAVPGMGGGW